MTHLAKIAGSAGSKREGGQVEPALPDGRVVAAEAMVLQELPLRARQVGRAARAGDGQEEEGDRCGRELHGGCRRAPRAGLSGPVRRERSARQDPGLRAAWTRKSLTGSRSGSKRFPRHGHPGGWLSVGRSDRHGPAHLARSGEDGLHDLAVDVGQAEIAAGVAVGEPLVVEAEQVQDRGVEVVDADRVLRRP